MWRGLDWYFHFLLIACVSLYVQFFVACLLSYPQWEPPSDFVTCYQSGENASGLGHPNRRTGWRSVGLLAKVGSWCALQGVCGKFGPVQGQLSSWICCSRSLCICFGNWFVCCITPRLINCYWWGKLQLFRLWVPSKTDWLHIFESPPL